MPTHLIWITYSISNIVAVLMLWATWRKPAFGRVLFFLLFAWAFWTNTQTALRTPAMYTGFAQFAFFEWYRQFINGYFATHTAPIVLAIATGQALIALAMLAEGPFFRMGAAGGILFLLAISPLGIGSAFPSTLILAAGLVLLYQQGSSAWLWHAWGKKGLSRP